MQKHGNKKVVAVVEDLFFTVKIADTAKRLGLETIFVKTEKEALEQARLHPLVIILDLNINGLQPLKLIQDLKGHADTKGVSMLAFVSHIQGELKQKAYVTVLHNGILVHNRQEILGRTNHRQIGDYKGAKSTGPIQLYEHGNPVRFRNIWIRPLGEYDAGEKK